MNLYVHLKIKLPPLFFNMCSKLGRGFPNWFIITNTLQLLLIYPLICLPNKLYLYFSFFISLFIYIIIQKEYGSQSEWGLSLPGFYRIFIRISSRYYSGNIFTAIIRHTKSKNEDTAFFAVYQSVLFHLPFGSCPSPSFLPGCRNIR